MSENTTPKNNRHREAAEALPEAPNRVTRVSRQYLREQVFRDDWESISDEERTSRLRAIHEHGLVHDWNSVPDSERAARIAAINAAAMPEGPSAGPVR